MTRIYSYSVPISTPILDAFCSIQEGFTDQFVYFRKDRPHRFMGLGRCVAVASLDETDINLQGIAEIQPVFFSFQRFDGGSQQTLDALFASFPQVQLMLPELVLIENERGSFLQVNSLGPVYEGRVQRFAQLAERAQKHRRTSIPYELISDKRTDWERVIEKSLEAIRAGRISKVVPARCLELRAKRAFSSAEVLANLIDNQIAGTVFLYRYGDVFFCGCTPELLVRKSGRVVESMCLAGSISAGNSSAEQKVLADRLLHDEKNLREHAYVVDFMRALFARSCYDVEIPEDPGIVSFKTIQHLYTPVRAKLLDNVDLVDLVRQMNPTPALAGFPVGEARMLLRKIESFNRGLFGGACGYVNGQGDGEFSVAIRSGVFDGQMGYVFAGCGVVDGSDAHLEYEETSLKFLTILSGFDAS